jgi:hypothetical protein
LIVFASANTPNISSLNQDIENDTRAATRNALQSCNQYLDIDFYDASKNTPTLNRLFRYQAIIIWIDAPFQSGEALGNVLAAYWDAGGAVVQSASTPYSSGLRGRFGEPQNGYVLFNTGGGGILDTRYAPREQNLSIWAAEPLSQLLIGVPTVTVNLNESVACLNLSTEGVINHAAVVAYEVDENLCSPLILRGSREGRNLVFFHLGSNLMTENSSFNPAIQTALQNAMQYTLATSG